jgi:hypothetical protein
VKGSTRYFVLGALSILRGSRKRLRAARLSSGSLGTDRRGRGSSVSMHIVAGAAFGNCSNGLKARKRALLTDSVASHEFGGWASSMNRAMTELFRVCRQVRRRLGIEEADLPVRSSSESRDGRF